MRVNHEPPPMRTFESREAYSQFVGSAPPPTADDCTILEDGTRIDTPEKARVYMRRLRAESIAGHARDAVSLSRKGDRA